ncbi:MAG: transposase [Gammaproteobacteria bacterium]
MASSGNHCNGNKPRTVLTPDGEVTLSIPRDRHKRVDSTLIGKYQRRLPGFNDKTVAPYAPGHERRRHRTGY